MRKLLALGAALLLAACQTIPAEPSFSQRQVTTLQQEGFKPVGENWELGIADRVLFGVDSSDLQPESAVVIDRLTKILLSVQIQGALVEGHTDSTGSPIYNQALSLRRAQAVKAAMVVSGMGEPAVRVVGLGETDPIENNETEDGRAQNRRVVVIVAPSDLAKD